MLARIVFVGFIVLLLLGSCKKNEQSGDGPPSNTDTLSQDTLVNPQDTLVDIPEDTSTTIIESELVEFVIDQKVGGISFESPSSPFPEEYFETTQTDVAANWIAFSPFAFNSAGSSTVSFSSSGGWWGENPDGIKTMIGYARNHNMKVLLKPQVWGPNIWVGDFDAETEEGWQNWEETYRDYILIFAEIAAEENVDLFCVGTEYKIAAVERPDYWRQLISEVREIYDGPITYASNWDNYQNIPFWDALDVMGIDSYFPLVNAKTPEFTDLIAAWQPIKDEIGTYATDQGKKVLFTEYGYMSSDYTAWENWNNENNLSSLDLNMQGQVNSFNAFFNTVWQEDWFAGGFIWKWHANPTRGGENDKDYTPQNKPVREIIKSFYDQD